VVGKPFNPSSIPLTAATHRVYRPKFLNFIETRSPFFFKDDQI